MPAEPRTDLYPAIFPRSCRTLLELNVSGCGGTDAAFLALAKAVEANATLGTLLYTGNHLNTTTLAEMDYALGRPKRPVRELVGQVHSTKLGHKKRLAGILFYVCSFDTAVLDVQYRKKIQSKEYA